MLSSTIGITIQDPSPLVVANSEESWGSPTGATPIALVKKTLVKKKSTRTWKHASADLIENKKMRVPSSAPYLYPSIWALSWSYSMFLESTWSCSTILAGTCGSVMISETIRCYSTLVEGSQQSDSHIRWSGFESEAVCRFPMVFVEL